MEPLIDSSPEGYRAGYASIFGRPNVGKSTLLNQILGFKLSIISPKPQTTRHRILGIHSSENAQIIFLDTPGLIQPRYQLQRAMMKAVRAAVEDANVILFMLEAPEGLRPAERDYLARMQQTQKPILILLNKIDLMKKNELLPLMDQIATEFQLPDIIPISALLGDGVVQVIGEIIKRLPKSPPFYPEEMVTEHPERFIVSEIIREQIFNQFGEEIPYSTTVLIDEYREREEGKDYIRATIITERNSQKGILIGKKGAALKKIGARAREEIERFLGRGVYLQLWVKVREKWRKSENAVREFGYGSHIPRR